MIKSPEIHRFRLVKVLICSCLLPLSVSPEEVPHDVQEDSTTVPSSSHVEHAHSDSSGSSRSTEQSSEHTSSHRQSTESVKESGDSVEESAEHHTSEEVVPEDDGSRVGENVEDNPSISDITRPQQRTQGGVEQDSDVSDEIEGRRLTKTDDTPTESHTTNTPVSHSGSERRDVDGSSDGQHIEGERESESVDGVSEKSTARVQYRRELLKQRERLLMQQQAEHQQQQQEEQQSQKQSSSGREEGSAKQELVEQREQLLRQQQVEKQWREEEVEIEDELLREQREDLLMQQTSQRAKEDGDRIHSHPSEVSDVRDDRDTGTNQESVHHSSQRAEMNRESRGYNPSISEETGEESEVHVSVDADSWADGLPGEPLERQGKREGEEEGVGDGTCQEDSPAACSKNDVYEKGMELVSRMDPDIKAQGYELLKEAAESGYTKALEQLAYAHLDGSILERNFTWSFEKFSELAEKGNPIGQQGLGFMYSTGIGVNSSQAKGLIYYTFAALGGHYFAQMAMGYRSLMGISVAQSCETALYYYQKAARKVVDEVTILTGGLLISKVRLMEEDNEATNVYGVSEDDMIQYHNVFADSGNTGAQVLLGVYYMFGMAGAERNFEMALKFLSGAANEGFAAANALIGKIYIEGSEEVPRDYVTAMEYFKRAKDLGHGDGYSGLGVLYFYGMGLEQDYAVAHEYFQKGADKGSAEAQYYLGLMFYGGIGMKRNLNKALRYFQLASHGGHVLAVYRLGEMHAEGRAVKRNCNYAVELLKGVAERGKWTRVFEDAERSYRSGDLDSALMVYLLLAEMGVEVAQTNAAYILEQDGVTIVHEKETLKRALILWNRSASQGYAMARVKLGDYYYYGQGTEVSYEAAASQYRIASDKQSSAQAMFNLGYMYQRGYGLQKDYHLAKRYYDQAAETSGDAHIPVTLALIELNTLYYCDFILEVMSSPVVTQAVGEVQAVTGENWDMYLITLFSGLLALVVMWRWRWR